MAFDASILLKVLFTSEIYDIAGTVSSDLKSGNILGRYCFEFRVSPTTDSMIHEPRMRSVLKQIDDDLDAVVAAVA